MEALMTLTLPWPPSVNHYWRWVPLKRRGHRVLISREGRAYRRRVCAALAASRYRTQAGRLDVRVVLCPPNRRKFDLDNRMKALLDALTHARVMQDDEQIDRLVVERGEIAKPHGRAVVVILEAQPA